MNTFSKIYDPGEVVLVYLIPCLLIFVLNALTIRSFYERGQKALAKANVELSALGKGGQHVAPFPEVPFGMNNSVTIVKGNQGEEKSEYSGIRDPSLNQSNMSLATHVKDRIQHIKDRNQNIIILTSLLSMITFFFSIPWVIYVFIKSSYWLKGKSACKIPFTTLSYCLIYTKFYLFPYLILLGNTVLRGRIIAFFVSNIFKPIKKICFFSTKNH
ncbi:unnamed protein product [Gordionus sp. m RMFG-2023]